MKLVATSSELPRSVHWFAIWKWRRSRSIPVILVVMLLAYAGSPSLVDYVLYRLGMDHGLLGAVYRIVYWPILWLSYEYPVVEEFYLDQILWL